jgi:ketosteroid isomerase-like protein
MTVDMARVQAFLDAYIAAWRAGDPAAAAKLFSEDATYVPTPWERPLQGRDQIARMWSDETDDPGTFDADYAAELVAGDRAVGFGRTRYKDTPKFPGGAEYHNVFLLRFDDEGLVREYREWYMKRPRES